MLFRSHEDLVGRYKTGNTKAEKVTKIIKESVCHLGLDLDDCRGQGYHEACNMKSRLPGVQARITSECPNAIFIRCFCHSLNLVVQDCSKEILMMRNALDTIQELSNLIQFSPKRRDFFERMRLSFDLTWGALRPLCPTRWSAKAKTFEWVLHNLRSCAGYFAFYCCW